jgi:hypothetical protein
MVLMTREGPVTVHGLLLGQGSSRSNLHSHINDVAAPGQKCKACRWSEVKIIRLTHHNEERLGAYIVHTAGLSNVPGEMQKVRLVRTDDAASVISALIVRKFDRGELCESFITRPAQDALDDAADNDEKFQLVFDQWISNPVNEMLLDTA